MSACEEYSCIRKNRSVTVTDLFPLKLFSKEPPFLKWFYFSRISWKIVLESHSSKAWTPSLLFSSTKLKSSTINGIF